MNVEELDLTLSASAMAIVPSTSIPLPSSWRVASDRLIFRASAIDSAPLVPVRHEKIEDLKLLAL